MRRLLSHLLFVGGLFATSAWAASDSAANVTIDTPASTTQDFQLLAHGFPAFSMDRQSIVIARTDSSGPKDFRALLFTTWNIAHEPIKQATITIVADSEEYKLADKTLALSEVAARIAKAERLFSELKLSPLETLFDESSPTFGALATGRQMELELSSHGLYMRFSRSDSRLLISTTSGATINEMLRAQKSAATHCKQQAAVPAGIWIDANASVLVLQKRFLGSDSCVEPADEWAVIKLASSKDR